MDVGWVEVFKAEGKPVQASEVTACCMYPRGSKEARVGGLGELRRVKGTPSL